MSTTGDNNDRQCWNGGEMVSSKKEYTSCEQNNNNVDNITEGIDSIGVSDMSTCANCGKEGNSTDMNTCNKCQSVKYCNAACKKKHRKKHKKACEKRVAELHEEKLFKEVEREECPICMLPLPSDASQISFQSCCGKTICNGCIYAMKMSEGKDLCAYCRTPYATSDEENINRTKELMGKGNGEAFSILGGTYANGMMGLRQDYQKANELYLKGGELGCAGGYYNLGCSYRDGQGVQMDKKKAKHYFEQAAMCGHIKARHNLGGLEWEAGNEQRAYKHFIIAARAGFEISLDEVKKGFVEGHVTSDEYANTLWAQQQRLNEMKSDKRDEAFTQRNL